MNDISRRVFCPCRLVEELFTRRITIMGSAADDPGKIVGVFNPDFVGQLALRQKNPVACREMEID